MGFDLRGLEPTDETGEYFRNSVWWWRPLAKFVLDVCDIPEEERNWYYHEQQCVSKETALHIADRLQELVESGEVKQYAEERDAWLESLTDEQCDWCHGTGQRDEKYAYAQCAACEGKGMKKPWVTLCSLDEKNVVNFIAFCKNSGGFVIR